jgi:hypothetical protein
MQQSLEEILRSRMAQPVSIKGKEGATVMPMEAIPNDDEPAHGGNSGDNNGGNTGGGSQDTGGGLEP